MTVDSMSSKSNDSEEEELLYTVKPMDTLEGIAARHDMTIGQLMKLNRLCNRIIFPGQVLHLPSAGVPASPLVSLYKQPSFEVDEYCLDAQPDGRRDADADCLRQFMKIQVREFTETEGVVSGVLLATPNCLMFDPDVSHPLVVENGVEKYSMVVALEQLVSVSLFKNVSALTDRPSPEELVYPSPTLNSGGRRSNPSADTEDAAAPATAAAAQDVQTEEAVVHQKQARSSSNDDQCLESDLCDVFADNGEDDNKEEEEEVEQNLNWYNNDEIDPVSALPNRTRVFKALSLAPLSQMGMSYINRAGHSILNRAQSVGGTGAMAAAKAAKLVTGVPKRIATISTDWLNTQESVGLKFNDENSSASTTAATGENAALSKLKRKTAEAREIASSDGCPFPTVDELFPYQRRGEICTEMPFFLHIQVKQTDQSSSKTQFWFSFPPEMADSFCSFLLLHCPDKYGTDCCGGEGTSLSPSSTSVDCTAPSVQDGSFVIVNGDDQDLPARAAYNQFLTPDKCSLNRQWEIVTVDEAKRRLSLSNLSSLAEQPLPSGCQESRLLKVPLIRRLMEFLPARAQGYPWVLVYSSELHGFALSTLYRHMAMFKDCMSPSLLVIRDTDEHTFGCVVNCLLAISDHFYGTGESLLFTDYPQFEVYRWTGANNYIVKGSGESLAFGAGNGVNGLWLDSDLYHGRTEPCDTFDNRPLTQSTDFVISGVEAWCFRLND
ncbi:putative LysM domain protein [Trichinella spiralis]|uniref:putative LysM domain protein n=1 Tax=Trichinella spiralis TaxID=6334 RepID=UPI0001EFCBA2|nr:putative LysM domain protein [Trichinella spiralis]